MKKWYYRDHNNDNGGNDTIIDQGNSGLVADSAAGSNGTTRRLLDASHRGVIGGLGVEGQENRGVVICIEHPRDGPPGELDSLEKIGSSGHQRSHMQDKSGLTRV